MKIVLLKWLVLMSLICCMGIFGCTEDKPESFPELSGPYLGQKLPGDSAELFAPGIVSTSLISRDIAMMPDGKEIYFSTSTPDYRYWSIFVTKEIDGKWTEPEVVHFANPDYWYIEPSISFDGKKMLFVSNINSSTAGFGGFDIWAVDRIGNSWGEPYNLGRPINTSGGETFPSLTKDGTLYFTRGNPGTTIEHIYRSRFVDGYYQTPEQLPDAVNIGSHRSNAYIARDESYLILPVLDAEDSRGGRDYYIFYRDKEDNWSKPINLGDKINTSSRFEYSPYVTNDNKYFFFMSAKYNIDISFVKGPMTIAKLKALLDQPENGNIDVYWIKADFINNLRPEGF